MVSKKRLVDIGLVVIILSMGALVYFQINRMIGDVRSGLLATESSQDPIISDPAVEPTTSTPEPEMTQQAEPAPDFSLISLEGDTVALSDHKGQAVMINFWATWCPPCLAELPLIESYGVLFEEELVVLAVNSGEERESVYNFVNRHGYDLLFLLDPTNSLATEYRIRGLPTSVFIDKEGLIHAIHIGILNDALLSGYLSEVGVVE